MFKSDIFSDDFMTLLHFCTWTFTAQYSTAQHISQFELIHKLHK